MHRVSLSAAVVYGDFPPPVGIMTNKDDLSDVLLLCNRALIMVHVCECIQTHQCNPRWQIRPPAGSYEKRTDCGGRHRNKHCATSDKHETRKQKSKNPPVFLFSQCMDHVITHKPTQSQTHTTRTHMHTHTPLRQTERSGWGSSRGGGASHSSGLSGDKNPEHCPPSISLLYLLCSVLPKHIIITPLRITAGKFTES